MINDILRPVSTPKFEHAALRSGKVEETIEIDFYAG